ncbi:hypothetical protein GCM10023310_72130 [Paenibacillus vulneris]|uniref:DNRLRE domain-containing protein n=1 Tax=Paenibacillus vulneris TaxID=1133364 RepID=A0ABW3UHR3_9BACL
MSEETVDLGSYIIIQPKNKMTAKVSIIAIGEENLLSNIILTRYDEMRSNVNVYSDSVIEDIAYPPRFGNQRKASITITHRSNLNSYITISPRNRMVGLVDITQKPKKTVRFYPVKDAFVREGIKTLNYGSEQSMLVGYDGLNNQERYRSFVGFDLTGIPNNIKIEKAEVKLFSSTVKNIDQQIGLYSLNEIWTEYGITWQNQPSASSIIDIKSVGRSAGYVSFDATDSITSLISNKFLDCSYELKALTETTKQFVSFETREGTNKPYLEITYTEDIIYSVGKAELSSNVFLRSVGAMELKSKITIPSIDDNALLLSRIHILNPNMIESSVIVNHPDMTSKIWIRQNDTSKLASSITLRQKALEQLQSHVAISRKEILIKINVMYRANLSSSLTIKSRGNSSLNSKITVSREYISGRLNVRRKDQKELNGSINIKQKTFTDLNSRIGVNRQEIPSSIMVVLSSYLDGTLSVRQTKDDPIESKLYVLHRKDLRSTIDVVGASMLPSSIYINSGNLKSQITIPAYENNDLLSRATIRVKWANDLKSTIFVGGDNIEGGFVFII